jgi:hypothetical protein
MKNEIIVEADLQPDQDDLREEALERAFVQHDTLEFNGKPIRPISAGSMAMLQRTKNGLIFGDSSNSLFDLASFILIHTDDEKEFKAVRRTIFSGDWPEYVINWMDSTPDVLAKLTVFVPTIARLRQDQDAAFTRSLESNAPGNAGGRTG